MTFLEIVSGFFIVIGTFFMLISSIGLIRLPDFYIRNSASTKALALGIGLILLGIAIYYNNIEIFIELFAIFFFIYLITPLSAHIIARAAAKSKVKFWDKTQNMQALEEYRKKSDEKAKQNEKR
jgi:multicomponent Na+:H+ antiporter subunit G